MKRNYFNEIENLIAIEKKDSHAWCITFGTENKAELQKQGEGVNYDKNLSLYKYRYLIAFSDKMNKEDAPKWEKITQTQKTDFIVGTMGKWEDK